jgi:hypothetical protein
MSAYSLPRYYKRQEKEGFWSLMPLRGPHATDAVIVNSYTYQVLDLLESGKRPTEIVGLLCRMFPEEDERKVRIDLFHTLARLGKYDFVDVGGFAENLAVLQEREEFLKGCVQPCPVNEIATLARYLKQFTNGGSGTILYNSLARMSPAGYLETTSLEVVSCVECMLEAQTTGGEIYWASLDKNGEISAAAATSNYMLLQPVVTVNILVTSGDERSIVEQRAIDMMSQMAETLRIFGLNEKLRVTSCPAVEVAAGNLTVADEAFFSVLGHCQFKKTASMKGEIGGMYDAEYYDRAL